MTSEEANAILDAAWMLAPMTGPKDVFLARLDVRDALRGTKCPLHQTQRLARYTATKQWAILCREYCPHGNNSAPLDTWFWL